MSKKKQGERPPRRLGAYTNIALLLELTEPQRARLDELHPDVFDTVLSGVTVTDAQLNSLVDLIVGLAQDEALRDVVDRGLVEKFTRPDGEPGWRLTGLGEKLDEDKASLLLRRIRATEGARGT